ncbi:cell division protein FtsB [Salinicola corii]|uniref:Cell division protein FtsB n=2 Tax=Salinicola TaxID=404432 RepID=A0A640WCQ2_9GAMM|nr:MULTISPECIES: cell division protein FtsB [Salinicola]KAA0017585.1 cell division protein FtsB [Salinicola corii]MDH4572305.1 cell division protein FtsB [Salinicola acroporae]
MWKWVIVVLVVMLGLMQYRLWFGEGGIREFNDIQARADTLEGTTDTLKARNDRLAAEVVDLKNGLDAIEERARSDIGMVRQDEQFFWVPGVDSPGNGPAASTGVVQP